MILKELLCILALAKFPKEKNIKKNKYFSRKVEVKKYLFVN